MTAVDQTAQAPGQPAQTADQTAQAPSEIKPKATFLPTLPPTANPLPPARSPESESSTAPPPEFLLGFALLKSQLGALMGDPLQSEQGNAENCDTQQMTTTGLAYWRCAANLLTFAALPDGQVHWAWIAPGLAEWTGAADPPLNAPVISAAGPADNQADPPTTCLAAGQAPSLMCNVADRPSVSATIVNPGDTNVFHFRVPAPGAKLMATFTFTCTPTRADRSTPKTRTDST